MEESEKRKERLKTMRMEAAEAGAYSEAQSSIEGPFGHGLTNPLIESPSATFGQAEPYARPRFDYYTDPMAAFSANKRRNNVSPQVSQQCNTPPRPRHPSSPAYHARANNPQDQRLFQSQGIHPFIPLGSPGQTGPFGTPPGNSSNPWVSSVGTPNNYFPPKSPPIGTFASPGFPRACGSSIHYQQGRGQPDSLHGDSPYHGSGYRGNSYQGSRFGGSPHRESGRGRGQWMGNTASPGSVQIGRKGIGSSQCTSAKSRPDLYYNKSMAEDPWKLLKPVIWKPIDPPPDSRKSWLPKSISIKKAKLAEAPLKSTQQSLAEFLSASFNEAAGIEAPNDESGA